MIRVSINGLGRIGCTVLRAIYEGDHRDKIEVVAVNDLAPIDTCAHLLKFDSAHGRFHGKIDSTEKSLVINNVEIPAYSERDPAKLPWEELEVDIVFECTGAFRDRDSLSKHLEAGAKKVLLSAPGKDMDASIVYGVNQSILKASDTIVSNASCTTNCLAQVVKAVHDAVGIKEGLATTIHAMTNTQNVVDAFHKDKRRARAASYSMIPTSTGSAKAISKVIPEMAGKLDAVAVRVPILNVSLLDLTFTPEKTLSKEQLGEIFHDYAKGREGVFSVNQQPMVSIDFNHDAHSCVVDIEQTRVTGNLVKVLAWYDNEWGYSNRMLDTALAMHAA